MHALDAYSITRNSSRIKTIWFCRLAFGVSIWDELAGEIQLHMEKCVYLFKQASTYTHVLLFNQHQK